MEKEETRQRAAQLASPEEMLVMVVLYCLTAGPPWSYREWPPKVLKEYLAFHALHGTLAWTANIVPGPGGRETLEVNGCGVAWQTNEDWIRERHRKGQHVFDWRPTDAAGDSLFLADFISSEPSGLKRLLGELERRHPDWKGLKYFTYRKGKLVQVEGRYAGRMMRPLEH